MLEQELKHFESLKPKLLKDSLGKFVLIKEKRLIGNFASEAEAYEAGIKELGNVSFLIKQVAETEETVSIPVINLGLM